jgi:hypothetical protein
MANENQKKRKYSTPEGNVGTGPSSLLFFSRSATRFLSLKLVLVLFSRFSYLVHRRKPFLQPLTCLPRFSCLPCLFFFLRRGRALVATGWADQPGSGWTQKRRNGMKYAVQVRSITARRVSTFWSASFSAAFLPAKIRALHILSLLGRAGIGWAPADGLQTA